MNKGLTHKQRVDRMLNGEDIDRPPVSAWRHFYDKENSRNDLVNSMLAFQAKFDWDFIKINSRASYHVEDWGVRLKFSSEPLTKPVALHFPVSNNSDWAKIKPLDWRRGALGENLSAGEEILSQAGAEVYCLPTIFSPLSVAADMIESDDRFIDLLNQAPTKIHGALEAITETFCGYVEEFIRMGMAGIFLATTEWASRRMITEEQYLEFGRPYDLRVLKAACGGFFNVTHVCNSYNMLALFRDYPAPVLSWNPFETGNLQIGQAAQITEKIFLTGIDQDSVLLRGPEEAIVKQVRNSISEAPPGRFMAGPGCAFRVDTPDVNLFAYADAVKGWKP